MDRKITLKEIYLMYRNWVVNHPTLATDVETVATWSSYLVAGKINKSALVSELVYSISKLVSLFNDRLISAAYECDLQCYGLKDQIKLWLTVIHYSEVFVELFVKSKWGMRGKWTAVTILQVFKCMSSLVLLLRFKEVPISHPPIPSLQRKKFFDRDDQKTESFFTLKRSGRVMRRVYGAPPVAFRDWQPVRFKDDSYKCGIEVNEILYAECLHVLKPLIHLAAMRIFGMKSWKQWLVALSVDVTGMRLYGRHMKDMSSDQRLELSRRKLGLVLYLLRSPMYNGYSKNVIENVLRSMSQKLTMTSFICGPVIQYLNHWQDIYFYMWSS